MSFIQQGIQIGSRILPIIFKSSIRAGSKYGSRALVTSSRSKSLGKLSNLSKRTITNLSGNIVGGIGTNLLYARGERKNNIRHLQGRNLMPYGYRRSYVPRRYSRYSRRPMYRRRTSYRSRRYY